MKTGERPFGLSAANINKIQDIFSGHPKIKQVIIYGSRAKGNYHTGSDIDLSIVGEPLDSGELSNIEAQLDDLLLPYKIDLSERSKIENVDLAKHIDRVGQVFFQSGN